MQYERQIGPNDILEYVEDAKEWEQDVDLDWFKGWFESLFPRLEDNYLAEKLKRMENALAKKGKTRAVWPLSLILAGKEGESDLWLRQR